ncbi:MAG: transposase DNA-binding-containing protein, partial [Legionella sp.]|nr:transposase DNA-binding-containing protein [Legionella sp.]
MNSTLSDSSLCSEALFGGIELGDKRLTKRLVQIGNQLSNWSGSSLSESSLGDEALVEGGYR